MVSAQPRVPLSPRCLRVLAVAAVLWTARPTLAACVIDAVEVTPRGNEVAVCFSLSKGDPPQCQTLSLADPPRFIIDLNDAALTAPKHDPVAVKAGGIDQVRIAQFQADPAVVRVVFDLSVAPDTMKWTGGSPPGHFCLRVGPSVDTSVELPHVTTSGKGALVRVVGAGASQFTVGALEDPPRVYVDIMGARAEASARQACSQGPVREVRIGQHEPEPGKTMTRVAAELTRHCTHAVYRDGFDLVMALDVPPPDAATVEPYQPTGALKGLRIVVDPGHGGEDVGAPATPGPPAQGPFEKDIVLDIGLRLARLLLAEGAQVRMTRSDDRFITLKERSDLANTWKANALISIHCNSCKTPNSVSGTSVYYDHEHSVEFAGLVQKELIAALKTKDNGVRNANFSVIRRATMPGILVETAFINHQGDRARLMTPEFRERAAHAIVRGLQQFIAQSRSGGRAQPR